MFKYEFFDDEYMTEVTQVRLCQEGLGKFVQILARLKGEEFPFFWSAQKPVYHSTILANFLGELNLPYDFTRNSEGLIVPNKQGDNYELVGSGDLYVNPDSHVVFIFDERSGSYSTRLNRDHLERVKSFFPEDMEVRIA